MCGGYKKGENPSERGKNKIQWITDLPAGLRGRVILGKGNDMSDFEKELHAMFDHIWDCEIDHTVFQDTVGELMEAVIQTYEKHKPTLGTNLAEVGTDCISRQAAIDAVDEIEAEVADGYGYQYAKWREYFVEMPPAEPEIIRCKDCKYNATSKKCLNPNSFFLVSADDDFCSYAERREVTT